MYREVDFVPLYFPEHEDDQEEEEEKLRIMQDPWLYIAAFARILFVVGGLVGVITWTLKFYK